MKIIGFRKRVLMKPTIFCSMIYPVCNVLDIIINTSLNKGIKNVKHSKIEQNKIPYRVDHRTIIMVSKKKYKELIKNKK